VEANIFRGLAGELWIDQAQERLNRLDAHVIANVDFGWGILGKLDFLPEPRARPYPTWSYRAKRPTHS
jgi:hypothetical protein